MPLLSWRKGAFILITGLSVGACATYGGYGGNYGYGGGYGYGDNYGYGGRSGVSVSIGTGNYWGWNDGYYYPGTGYYVYDRYRRPYRWNGYQQRYWSDRQNYWRHHYRRPMRSNWRHFRYRG
jgi:hypothetical protein